MIWYASGWWAVVRTLRGRTGWAKTDRVAEAPVALSLPASAGVSAMPARVVAVAYDVPVTPGQLAAQLAEAPTQPIPTVPVQAGPLPPSRCCPVQCCPAPSGPGRRNPRGAGRGAGEGEGTAGQRF